MTENITELLPIDDAMLSAYQAADDWVVATFKNGEEKHPHFPMIHHAVSRYIQETRATPSCDARGCEYCMTHDCEGNDCPKQVVTSDKPCTNCLSVDSTTGTKRRDISKTVNCPKCRTQFRKITLPSDKADVFDDEYLQEAYDMAIAGMENETNFTYNDYDIITALANGTKGWLNRALQQPDYKDGGIHEYMGKPYSRRKLEEENGGLVNALEIIRNDQTTNPQATADRALQNYQLAKHKQVKHD